MKKYIGTKQIEAEPMTRGDAWGKHLLREKPTPENFDDAGYHVRYKDGYESWSPKEVFEEAYKCSDTHLDRMRIELDELKERLTKAIDFYYSEKAGQLSRDEAYLLGRQISVMREYADVLLDRIKTAYGINLKKISEIPQCDCDKTKY